MAKAATPYRDQLRDPRWQKKRLEALEKAYWECENCGDKTTMLHVHHKRYVKGCMAWEYELDQLVVLCEPCHEGEHDDRLLIDKLIAEASPGMLQVIIGLCAGYLDAGLDLNDEGLGEMCRQTSPMYYELGVAAYVLECPGERDVWRKVVSEYASKKPVTPTIKHLIDLWNDEIGKK